MSTGNMTRPKEPNFIASWRLLSDLTPQCCHTCDHYNLSGHCLKFDMRPPDDFAAQLERCSDWMKELPF